MSTSVEQQGTISRLNAAMISAGIGCMALAFFVVLAEVSTSAKDFLNLNAAVGPLAGKTIFTVLVWFVAWVFLNRGMRNSKMPFEKAYRLMLFMVAIGLLGTFPIFFQAFAPK